MQGSFNQQGLALIGHPVVNNATYNPNVFTNVIIPTTKLDNKKQILTNVSVSSTGVLKAIYGLDKK